MSASEEYELATRKRESDIQDVPETGQGTMDTGSIAGREDGADENMHAADDRLEKRTLLKLDTILLPFLSILFCLNSLDKSNLGNAETAGFTHDAGLSEDDLNISLAFFFTFFVVLQPAGAALGRRYGMARYVPVCMSLWGLCTLLHIWVHRRWQLILLRVVIAILEAGFYPTTVSYLSLFYTRFEFAQRLGIFYGQAAVAGSLGGVLSWAVFSHFPSRPDAPELPPGAEVNALAGSHWKSWEVLFLVEGCLTMVVAILGFFWLPQSADTAWFFTAQERSWAEQRMRLDRAEGSSNAHSSIHTTRSAEHLNHRASLAPSEGEDEEDGEAHDHLLGVATQPTQRHRKMSTASAMSVTADSGLSKHDVYSAFVQRKIWHLLLCNILSAIPATAFGVFLPLVMKQLSPALDLTPAQSNLLAAPPFACGAIVLLIFTRWSDNSHARLLPILCGLSILLVGLTVTVMTPMERYTLRYISLCILLSGSYIASPLTVAWLANNTPEPGKRAILLGINGWGNLAGVFSALLFTPADEKTGYVRPFVITLFCVLAAVTGFAAFRLMVKWDNWYRDEVCAAWNEEERKREDLMGDAPLYQPHSQRFMPRTSVRSLLGLDATRRGDEKLTFRYGL